MVKVILLAVCLMCASLSVFAQPFDPDRYPESPEQHHPDRHPGPPDQHYPEKHRQYPIDISASHGGYVSPEGRVHVREGESLFVSIRPERGFVVNKVVVDGRNIGPVRDYRLPHVERPHSIYVEFVPERYRQPDHRPSR